MSWYIEFGMGFPLEKHHLPLVVSPAGEHPAADDTPAGQWWSWSPAKQLTTSDKLLTEAGLLMGCHPGTYAFGKDSFHWRSNWSNTTNWPIKEYQHEPLAEPSWSLTTVTVKAMPSCLIPGVVHLRLLFWLLDQYLHEAEASKMVRSTVLTII